MSTGGYIDMWDVRTRPERVSDIQIPRTTGITSGYIDLSLNRSKSSDDIKLVLTHTMDTVFNIKQQISDNDYKNIVDNLKKIYDYV